MRLTHEAIEAAYDFLKACYPFCKMKLPDADELGFRVSRHSDRYGHFEYERLPFPEVAISERLVKTREDLESTMAHEMLHIYQRKKGSDSKRVQHNREFRRLAKLVCKEFGFDPKLF